MGVYEMLAEAETPSKVIINEAIELARNFSGEESVPFVNGVLDGVRKELRRS
jgi:N utilization substance protein B